MILLALSTVLFARYCVRVVPAERPGATGATARSTLPAQTATSRIAGTETGLGPLVVPVIGVHPADLSDTFTQSRESGARRHDAIDIPAPRGTQIVAAAPGRIEKLFTSEPGGMTIYVRSPDGKWVYYYAHLDAYRPGLAEGEQLSTGDWIGNVGSTGNADPAAPHLHFAINRMQPGDSWYQGVPVKIGRAHV